MEQALDIAKTYTGKTVGRLFASAEVKAARDDATEMIKSAGLSGKLVALIIPNDFHPNAHTALAVSGKQLVTLWGRAPESDQTAISSLIGEIKGKHGTKFTASDSGRVGPDGDIIVAPYTMHSEAKLPPKTW